MRDCEILKNAGLDTGNIVDSAASHNETNATNLVEIIK